MNPEEYKYLYELEEGHWWFVGMRQIVAALLDPVAASGPLRILDAGCGTGFTMSWLKQYGDHAKVYGLDFSSDALHYSRRRGEPLLVQGSVDALPFPSNSFDLIISLDVLDCFSAGESGRPFGEAARVLKEGGLILLRLPAFQSLHSEHDEAIRIVHRYTAGELTRCLEQQGLVPERVTYANTFLFPVAVIWRWWHRSPRPQPQSDVRPLPRFISWLNPVFIWALKVEAAWLRHLPFRIPVGLSVMALARKPSSSQ
jgi:SAM-dependent methyltransferase